MFVVDSYIAAVRVNPGGRGVLSLARHPTADARRTEAHTLVEQLDRRVAFRPVTETSGG